MPTYYTEIAAVQRPFPFSVDELQRTMFSANFTATALAPVDRWEDELARLIHDAGLGTLNVDMFIGPAANIPPGRGPIVSIIDSGGTSTMDSHSGERLERLSAQVVVRATNYQEGSARALAIWRTLNGKHGVTVAA